MDFYRSLQSFKRKVTDALSGSSRISCGPNLEDWSIDLVGGRASAEDLEKFYYSNPLVFSGINLFANTLMGRGYYVESEDSKAKKLCEYVLNLSSFKPTLLRSITQVLIYGEAFQEVIWSPNGKLIDSFKCTDPKTFEVKWDKFGNVVRYVQRLKGHGGEAINFDKEQIVHYTFWHIADSLKGIGLIEPLKKTLEIEADIQESIKEAIKRFAHPPLWIKKKGATDAEIKAMKEEFQDFDRKKFFGTSEVWDINFISLYHRFPDLRYHMEYILNKICSGLRIPKPILIAAGETTNRATLEALIDYNQSEIAHVQEQLTQIIEEQIFKPLCRRNSIEITPDLKWYPIVSEDERQKAEIRHLDIDSILRCVGAELITLEEARNKVKALFEKA